MGIPLASKNEAQPREHARRSAVMREGAAGRGFPKGETAPGETRRDRCPAWVVGLLADTREGAFSTATSSVISLDPLERPIHDGRQIAVEISFTKRERRDAACAVLLDELEITPEPVDRACEPERQIERDRA